MEQVAGGADEAVLRESWASRGFPGPMSDQVARVYRYATVFHYLKHSEYVNLEIPDTVEDVYNEMLISCTSVHIERDNQVKS